MTTAIKATDLKAALPLTFWPHYAVLMKSVIGALYLEHIRELHKSHESRYPDQWDGWFFFDHVQFNKRLSKSHMFSIPLFERVLVQRRVLERRTEKAGELKYYRFDTYLLECLLEQAKNEHAGDL